jgi:hypothetical protein
MQTNNPPADRDPKLWEIAQKRASFKKNLITYLIVNAFLWGIWYFTNGRHSHDGWPWPIWPTVGWGIGLLFHFFGAYVYPETNSVEREYDRLKKKNQQ